MTYTILITISRFATNIVAERIVLSSRGAITSKDHHIVLVELRCVLCIDLASFYGSNWLGDSLAIADGEHMIKMFTLVVLSLCVQEEHQLVLVIAIEELFGNQWIDLRLVNGNHGRI